MSLDNKPSMSTVGKLITTVWDLKSFRPKWNSWDVNKSQGYFCLGDSIKVE